MSQANPHRLNTLGLLCPLPILLAARDMGGIGPGGVIEIVGDDPGLLEDVPAWCDKNGYLLLGLEDEDGVIVAKVQKPTSTSTP